MLRAVFLIIIIISLILASVITTIFLIHFTFACMYWHIGVRPDIMIVMQSLVPYSIYFSFTWIYDEYMLIRAPYINKKYNS